MIEMVDMEAAAAGDGEVKPAADSAALPCTTMAAMSVLSLLFVAAVTYVVPRGGGGDEENFAAAGLRLPLPRDGRRVEGHGDALPPRPRLRLLPPRRRRLSGRATGRRGGHVGRHNLLRRGGRLRRRRAPAPPGIRGIGRRRRRGVDAGVRVAGGAAPPRDLQEVHRPHRLLRGGHARRDHLPRVVATAERERRAAAAADGGRRAVAEVGRGVRGGDVVGALPRRLGPVREEHSAAREFRRRRRHVHRRRVRGHVVAGRPGRRRHRSPANQRRSLRPLPLRHRHGRLPRLHPRRQQALPATRSSCSS